MREGLDYGLTWPLQSKALPSLPYRGRRPGLVLLGDKEQGRVHDGCLVPRPAAWLTVSTAQPVYYQVARSWGAMPCWEKWPSFSFNKQRSAPQSLSFATCSHTATLREGAVTQGCADCSHHSVCETASCSDSFPVPKSPRVAVSLTGQPESQAPCHVAASLAYGHGWASKQPTFAGMQESQASRVLCPVYLV